MKDSSWRVSQEIALALGRAGITFQASDEVARIPIMLRTERSHVALSEAVGGRLRGPSGDA